MIAFDRFYRAIVVGDPIAWGPLVPRVARLSPSTTSRVRVLDLAAWEAYQAAGLTGEEVPRD